MNRICVRQTVGIVFAVTLSLVPTLAFGQAGEDVILVNATTPEMERHKAAKFRCGQAARQIIEVIDEQGLDRSQFAASRDVLANQICDLEAAKHEADNKAETQDRITETEAREGETVDEHIVSPKPMFFLKTSSDPQGDALRDAIRGLFDMADSLERQQLPLRAAFLRDHAKHMRIDLLQGLRDNYGNYSGGFVVSRDPNACNLAADLQEKLKRLPTLKPRTGRRVELDEECYLLGKPNGLQVAEPGDIL